MKISIRQSDGKERVIGTLADSVFTKRVKESKHLLRKLDAWGIDAHVFTNTLMSEQCTIILIIDDETGKRYMTTTDIFKKHGEYKHYKPHRAQIFLSRRYFAQSGDILSADRIKEVLKDNHVGV